jgi:hypothetical protein
MLKRISVLLSVVVLAALAGSALADDSSGGTFKTTHDGDQLVGLYTDGRINDAQVVAPVAIYYTYGPEYVSPDGSRVHDINGITVLTINQTTGEGTPAFTVTLPDLQKAIADAGARTWRSLRAKVTRSITLAAATTT